MNSFYRRAVGLVAAFAAVVLPALAATAGPIMTTTLFTQTPIPLDRIVPVLRQRQESLMPDFNAWQLKYHARVNVDSLHPVINAGCIVGWAFTWQNSSEPNLFGIRYLEEKQPFTLAATVSNEAALADLWKKNGKDIRDCEATPIALNRNSQRIVYGTWYVCRARKESVKNGETGAQSSYRQRPESRSAQTLLITEGATIRMKPFKVSGNSLVDVDLGFDSDGVITIARIKDVIAGSPFDRAGIKEDMILKSVHGVDLVGLTRSEYKKLILEAPLDKDHTLRFEVNDTQSAPPREIIVKIPVDE